MNPKNYASLLSSKLLLEAGIILETEAYWSYNGYGFELTRSQEENAIGYPAPTMYEAWNKLPVSIITGCMGFFRNISDSNDHKCLVGYKNSIAGYLVSFTNINPADAIIDLLIWYKEYSSSDGR